MKITFTVGAFYKKKFAAGVAMLLLLFFSIGSYGFTPNPQKMIRIDKSQLLTVDEVFELIKKQTDYTFVYNSDLFENAPKVFIKKGLISVKELLKKSLSFGNFDYELAENGVILLEKKEAAPQGRFIVTGTVKNRKGDALPGVTILEKGTGNGVVSDLNGKYEIKVKDENAILVFSFIGYQTKEVKVNGQKVINVSLMESVAKLKEVEIVSTGYQKISRDKVAGAIQNVQKSFYQNSYTPNVQEGLQGSVPGLQIISNTSHPQAVPQVLIRGVGSAFQQGVGYVGIGGTSNALESPISLTPGSPLYVIDGVPTTDGKDLSNINPNDIKSITVLKDASAASIYGARGANGVIVVETKSGRPGKTKINFSTQVGFSKFTMIDKSLNTKQLQELYVEGLINNPHNGISNEQEAMQFLLNPGGSTTPFNPDQNTDWQDVLTRSSMMQQYNLSFSGGNEDNRYYISAGYLNNKTPLINIDFSRLNFNVKYDAKILKKVDLSTNISYNNLTSGNYESGTSFYSPFRSMYVLRPDLKIYNDDGTYNTSFNYGINPVGVLNEETRQIKTNDFRGFANLIYRIIPGLSLEPSFSADYKLLNNYNHYPADIGKGLIHGSAYAIQKNTSTYIWDARVLLRYVFTLKKDHLVNTFAGVERSATNRNIVFASADQMRSGSETLDNGIPLDGYTSRLETALSSFFVNADYSYKNKYFLNASFRRDGSSKFGPDNKYGNFYAVGVSWKINKENFLVDSKNTNLLKLRLSYGVNGNDQIGSFNYMNTFSGTGSYNGYGVVTIASAGDPSLGWEDNATFNLGVDFAFFNYRLSGTIDLYTRNTSNLLYNLGVSAFNGDTYVFKNFGAMNNKGIEVSLNSRNILPVNNGFSWNTTINFAMNRNKVTKLNEDKIISGIHIREVGQDFNSLYLYGYAGVDLQTGEELYYTDETETATTNNYRQAVKYNQGKTSPDFYGSFINTFSYKNFSLMLNFYTSWGGRIFETTGYIQNDNGYQRLRDYSNTSLYVYENRWRQPGDITDVPKYVYGNSRSQIRSTRWLHNGSYIRLRRVEFSYSFPKSILDKTFISQLRLFVSGDNIWTFVKDKTLKNDPEIGGITGEASFDTPPEKTVYFGLNMSF